MFDEVKFAPNMGTRVLCLERFVGGGAVETGDGEVVEAEVDAQLGSVVDEVVEEHEAEGLGAGELRDDVFAVGELPDHGEVFIGGGGECCAGVDEVCVKGGEHGFCGFEDEVRLGELAVGHVHAGFGEDVLGEEWQGGDVHGETAHGHGLVVTLVVGLFVGDALEGAASAGHFSVEVFEEKFGDGHWISKLFLADSFFFVILAVEDFGASVPSGSIVI